MRTDNAYWEGSEPADVCANIDTYLDATHGPPIITPMPDSVPCSQTAMCDPNLYNTIVATYYLRGELTCYGGASAGLTNINPLQCNTANSELFTSNDGYPIKAILCYNSVAP